MQTETSPEHKAKLVFDRSCGDGGDTTLAVINPSVGCHYFLQPGETLSTSERHWPLAAKLQVNNLNRITI